MEKLIITVAVTGAELDRKQQPNLPLSPDEIAQSAYQCFLKGASVAHVHARDAEGNPTQSKTVYAEIIKKIKELCPIIIQPSTGGAVWHSFEERMQPLELNPEMATLSTGSCNFGADIFVNKAEYIEKFAHEMLQRNIKPEIEIFERGMISNALALLKKGLLKEPIHFDFVMGVPGAIPAEIDDLVYLRKCLPPKSTWSVAGIGRFELPLAVHAILMGGHVRVGFEDNIMYERGVLAESNQILVERIAKISKDLGRPVATPDEARKILGIKI